MTDELDLDAIEALAKAATPGPWVTTYGLEEFTPDILRAWSEGQIMSGSFAESDRILNQVEHDAIFIAHAREDVPALVTEVRRLRDEGEALQERYSEAEKECIARRDNLEIMVKRLIEAENKTKRLRNELDRIDEQVASCGHLERFWKVEVNQYAWCVMCALEKSNLENLRLRAALAEARGNEDEYHYIVRPIQSPVQDFSDVFTCGYDVRILKLTDKARKLVRPPKLPDEAGHA